MSKKYRYNVPIIVVANRRHTALSRAVIAILLNWGLRLGESLLSADELIRKKYKVSLLSSESRILLHVAYNNCANIKQAHGYSMLSSRAFYTKVRKLTEQGYLQINTNTADRRKRSLRLTESGCTLVRSLQGLLPTSPQDLPRADRPCGLGAQANGKNVYDGR